MNDILIAYFSKSGRTKKIAEFIASEINAPLHEIITAKKYPKTYIMTILEARKEFKRNDKPAKIRELCKNSQVFDGIKANSLDKSKISEWLKDII